MKRALSNLFFYFLFASIAVRVNFNRIRNRRKKKILIYTDSRGHEITRLWNKNNPFSSYARYFIKQYSVDALICPEKHTTIYDFLYFMSRNSRPFDHVIAHVGVVCFSPRPESQFREVLTLKKNRIVELFGEEFYNKLWHAEGYDEMYAGERTYALVPEFALPLIAQKMNEIYNLTWITCTPVLSTWSGNYKRKRPAGTNMVNTKSLILRDLLESAQIVDLTGLSEQEIKLYTCDNVHLSAEGMQMIENKLRLIVEK